jgi:hypothetical protein
MSLSRDAVGGTALTLLNVDTTPTEEVMSHLLADPDIQSAEVIRL